MTDLADLRSTSLAAEWHGVPAGTVVLVVRQVRPGELYGDDAWLIERVDGKMLPDPYGDHQRTAIIDGQFLTH